jgi:sucrose-6-phosphate hydrolase SacC (GH32 family)
MFSLATALMALAVANFPKPTYHFTRAANEMNDPNGLMMLPRPDTTGGAEPAHDYHLYFQSNDPGQSVGSVWGAYPLTRVHGVLGTHTV